MANIGGNITAQIQVKSNESSRNAIGEKQSEWLDSFSQLGWLGLLSGQSKYTTFSAKLEESTHVFLCDYNAGIYALSLPDEYGNVPDVRMIVKGVIYDVILIDNPDEMDEQLEIHLRRVGGWNG